MSDAPATAADLPPDVSIRARPPSPKRLSRKVLLGGALTLAAIIAFAVLYGLSGSPRQREVAEPQNASASGPPDTIRIAPQGYDATDVGGANPTMNANDTAQLAPPADPIWGSGHGAPTATPAGAATVDLEATAHIAPILFSDRRDQHGATPASSAGDTSRHATFVDAQRNNGDRLEATLTPPRSRYELMSGAVVPAALQTELNSDLPGRIVAQVTAPVYDSVTGETLLIPQGARLIGAYDSATTYGDHRLLLVWNRLILPNGWSINLQAMEGSDASGAAGLSDRTDNHLGRLTGAVGLSAIISVIANRSEGGNTQSLTQNVGDAAAQQAAQTGGRIVDRELTVHPTLRVRAGAPVRVLVTRDIVLRPYRE